MAENTDNSRTHNFPLKILVCYHKPYTMPPNDDGILLPIQVGRALTDTDLHMQADNEVNGQPCDNISSKNVTYNELTAIYWAWKNLRRLYPEVQYVGLYHYRRFFAFDEKRYFEPLIVRPESAIADYRFNAEKVISILDGGKAILPMATVYPTSLAVSYCILHLSDDYRTARQIIKEKYPDYFEAFIDVMERGNKLFACNMFIMSYADFVRYCKWIFDVLSWIEPEVRKNLTAYQRRLFLSERLFNVWLYKNGIKAEHVNVYSYDDNKTPQRGLARRLLSRFKRELSMSISRLTSLKYDPSFIDPPKP